MCVFLFQIIENNKYLYYWFVCRELCFAFDYLQGTKPDTLQDSFDDKSIDDRTPVEIKKMHTICTLLTFDKLLFIQETSVDYSMMSEDESSMQEPSIKLDSSDEKAPTGRVSVLG